MRWMTSAMVSAVLVVVGGATARGASPEGALETPIRVSWSGVKLTDALAELAARAAVGFVLDPAMPAKAREALVTYASDRTPLKIALGRALKAAGLRYTVIGGAIWVSTPQRVAERVVYKGREDLAEAEPMSRGEALTALSPMDDVPSIGDLSRPQKPWRRPAPSTVNPVTGVTDFPAPPVWIDSEDADNPRFKYTNKPSFLKPDYKDGKESAGASDALAYAIGEIKKHPNWSREEILKMLVEALASQR